MSDDRRRREAEAGWEGGKHQAPQAMNASSNLDKAQGILRTGTSWCWLCFPLATPLLVFGLVSLGVLARQGTRAI